jgi:AraC-like DNA-binding protein
LPTFDINFGTGPCGLRSLRENSQEICEVSANGDVAMFQARTAVVHLGSVLLFESRSTAIRLHRTLGHVARSGIEHFQIQLPLAGAIHAADHRLGTGDLGIHDMTRPSMHEILAGPGSPVAHHLMLMVPRSQIAPLVTNGPDAAHGLRIDGRGSYAQLVSAYMLSLHHHVEALSDAERTTAVRVLLLLLAAGIDEAHHAPPRHTVVPWRAKLALIKRALEDEPLPDEVAVRELCRRFAISRATLYRMFEGDGGLVHYLRERRLSRAARMLVSPAQRHLRVIDIAVDHHFASDTAFIRAFKRRFGISPAALRASMEGRSPSGDSMSRLAAATTRKPMQWILEL